MTEGRVNRQRTNTFLYSVKCLLSFLEWLSVLTDNPKGDSNHKVRSNLTESLTDLLEDCWSVLFMYFDDLTDEKNRLQAWEGRFAFKLKEILYERR